jgi:hypothetical protein
MNAQDAANSLWAVATMGVSDEAIIAPLVHACVERTRNMNAQGAANSLWALAVLGVLDEVVVEPLAIAVSRLSARFSVANAQQVLQAHFGGVAVDAATQARCWALVRAHPELMCTTDGQRAVAAALARLGLATLLEVPALDGLLSVDIVARVPGDAACRAIAVEFDGPRHFLRAPLATPLGLPAPVCGPPDARTRLRDRLLRRSGAFAGLVVVTYLEWDTCGDERSRQEAFVADKLRREGLEWALSETTAVAAGSPASPAAWSRAAASASAPAPSQRSAVTAPASAPSLCAAELASSPRVASSPRGAAAGTAYVPPHRRAAAGAAGTAAPASGVLRIRDVSASAAPAKAPATPPAAAASRAAAAPPGGSGGGINK